ncbi:hypothetical protein [Acidovorax sp. A1169]|uniref:hypothetical protein n=1 Tax=Acidovorax sp. A1169 TaxID=3059524 RepID=UPI0027379DBB|nr:hypothetical protein [Acidovorax sp. A1169]MDP4074198.1 hypothetical protein [Acidovorax sp. A1169]
MLVRFDNFTRTLLAAALADLLNAGTGPVQVRFYTVAPPATPLTAITTQTLLGTLVCSSPAVSASGPVVTFIDIGDDPTADASGTAAWARVIYDDGAKALDVDVTNNAGTGAIKINTVTIEAGGPIQITSFTITVGGA